MKFFLIFSLLTLAPLANARTVNYGRAVVTIEMPFGKDRIFKFDKQVRTVSTVSSFSLKPVNNESADYSILSVKANDPLGDGMIAVILDDDSTVRIRLKSVTVAQKDLVDPVIEFKAYEVASSEEMEPQRNQTSEIDLMKAMIRDDFIAGFQKRELDKPVNTSQAGVSSKLIRQYEGENMHGYVFQVTNQMKLKSVVLDLRQLKLGSPNLAILSQADQLALSGKIRGKNETMVRIVAKSTSRFSDIRLPIGIKNPEAEVKK